MLNGPFRLVTMGRSFHWMDQEKVLKDLYDLVGKGGGLSVVGTEPIQQGSLSAKKDAIIQKLVKKYLGSGRRAGSGIYTHSGKRYEDLLPTSEFKDFKADFYTIKVAMDLDQIVGNLYSMSWANPNLFGNKLAAFETELRQELKVIKPTGKFTDNIRFGVYTVFK